MIRPIICRLRGVLLFRVKSLCTYTQILEPTFSNSDRFISRNCPLYRDKIRGSPVGGLITTNVGALIIMWPWWYKPDWAITDTLSQTTVSRNTKYESERKQESVFVGLLTFSSRVFFKGFLMRNCSNRIYITLFFMITDYRELNHRGPETYLYEKNSQWPQFLHARKGNSNKISSTWLGRRPQRTAGSAHKALKCSDSYLTNDGFPNQLPYQHPLLLCSRF